MKELVHELKEKGVLKTPEIINAFEKNDRRDFMNYEKDLAYADNAFPIGHGQTISQPTTVAIMLELLQPKEGDQVLDIGSGSGWTTALLASIVGEKGYVYAVEIIKELHSFGKANLKKSHLRNAVNIHGDGSKGLLEKAPFDKILVSAAAMEIPQPLKDQLKIGGTMVLPVMSSVIKLTKKSKDNFESEEYPYFAFVPLRGKYGREES